MNILDNIRARLVDDCTRWWKLLSIQVHLAAVGYLALYEIMPSLDDSIAKLLPTPFQSAAFGIYAVLGIASRLIAQKKPDAGS